MMSHSAASPALLSEYKPTTLSYSLRKVKDTRAQGSVGGISNFELNVIIAKGYLYKKYTHKHPPSHSHSLRHSHTHDGGGQDEPRYHAKPA